MPGGESADQVWARQDALVWQRVGEEGVILDPGNKVLRGINLAAWRVWELLDGTRTLSEVAQDLAQTFSIPRRRALTDVGRFVDELSSRELIRRVR